MAKETMHAWSCISFDRVDWLLVSAEARQIFSQRAAQTQNKKKQNLCCFGPFGPSNLHFMHSDWFAYAASWINQGALRRGKGHLVYKIPPAPDTCASPLRRSPSQHCHWAFRGREWLAVVCRPGFMWFVEITLTTESLDLLSDDLAASIDWCCCNCLSVLAASSLQVRTWRTRHTYYTRAPGPIERSPAGARLLVLDPF